MVAIDYADEQRIRVEGEHLNRHGIGYFDSTRTEGATVPALQRLTRIVDKLTRAEKRRQHGFCGCDECKEPDR